MATPAATGLPRWRTRLAWLGAFWIGGIGTMALVAGFLRWFMRLAGLAT